MTDLNGKSILVTGGGSGIGRATALLLAEAGAHVTVADYIEAAAAETADLICGSSGIAQFVRSDVRIESDVQAAVDKALSGYGRVDGAANCAGVPQHTRLLHELTLNDWNACLNVNLTGCFFCLKHQIAAMLRSGGGSIVVVASTAAVKGFPMASEYAASKSGLLGLVRCAAYEYGKDGIRINGVLPGGTDTPMLRGKMNDTPGLEDLIAAQHLLGRFAQPRELGAAIRWLLSDEASFVTGANIPIDGGQTAG
jgi:2,5-dichloro-2,5-cyclohexadiene-1,4-diol dehydrogenase 1